MSSLWVEVLLQTKSLSAAPGGGRWRKKPCEVVQDMKERDEHDKIQGRESVKRSLQSGEPNDPVDVERFDKKSRLVGPFKKVRTREEVDFQWDRDDVSVGIPMSFFDKRRFTRPS